MANVWRGALLIGLLAARGAAGEPVVHALERDVVVYNVNRDLTYKRLETQDITLNTARALRQLDRSARTFYPDKQSLELVEAWVDQADGSRVVVASGSTFTRPSAASQSAPGFVNSQTTTVLFPQLRAGSHTHVVWRFTQKIRPLLGFNNETMTAFDWDTTWKETLINIPTDVPLHWWARGYTVEDNVADGIRHISAHIENARGHDIEPAMSDRHDFLPLFEVTSVPSAEAIGAIVHRASDGRAEVTPEIKALALRIAGERTGLDAARAIHAWVAANIRYVAVYLNPEDGWIPHKASDVLRTGYGDCKDYVVLMQALLAALGVEGQMAAVNWGTRYNDLPLWPSSINHAILYLPQYDHYLNPTDRYASFDALDRRLSGKQVVLVTEAGRVGRTPDASPAANSYQYDGRVTLGRDGAIDGTARYTMASNMEIPVRNQLAAASSANELAQRLLSNTPEGGFGTLDASDPLDLLHPLQLSGQWHSAMAVNVEGREIFLHVPVGLDMYPAVQQRSKLSPPDKRHTPAIADVTDAEWHISIALPATMRVALMPPDVDMATPIGRYIGSYHLKGGMIQVYRKLVIEQEVVPPESYSDLERLLYAPIVDARAVIALERTGE